MVWPTFQRLHPISEPSKVGMDIFVIGSMQGVTDAIDFEIQKRKSGQISTPTLATSMNL